MSLCETCRKGRNEICRYFLAEFLENDTGCVTRCPEFEEEDDEPSEDLRNVDGVYAEDEDYPEEEPQA